MVVLDVCRVYLFLPGPSKLERDQTHEEFLDGTSSALQPRALRPIEGAEQRFEKASNKLSLSFHAQRLRMDVEHKGTPTLWCFILLEGEAGTPAPHRDQEQ